MEAKRFYEFGPFRLDANERLLMRNGQAIPLPPKDLGTLLVLVEQGGHIVEKSELLEKVWPGTFVEEGNLARHISNLRRALGDSPNGNRYIATIAKRGYRFVAPVKVGQIDASPTAQSTSAGNPGESPGSSLAVVPFIFLGGEEESECLSLGFADALITALGNLEDLTVLPTAAILRFPSVSDPTEACRALRVRHVLQGHIQKLGGQWRVSVQLFDAQAGKITFSDGFTFTSENVFEVQDEIGRCVASRSPANFAVLLPKFALASVRIRPRAMLTSRG